MIPPKKDRQSIADKFRTPLTFVLLQEIQTFNILTSTMWKSLQQLKKALAGQMNFSFELEEINKQLYHGQIPTLWKTFSPQTKKSLANWLDDFRQRNEQYDRWIENGKQKMTMESEMKIFVRCSKEN